MPMNFKCISHGFLAILLLNKCVLFIVQPRLWEKEMNWLFLWMSCFCTRIFHLMTLFFFTSSVRAHFNPLLKPLLVMEFLLLNICTILTHLFHFPKHTCPLSVRLVYVMFVALSLIFKSISFAIFCNYQCNL